MSMRDTAQDYRNRGWSIIPVKPGTKQPGVRSWKPYSETPADHRMISQWWPDDKKGIAVILGDVSGGLICRDFDQMAAYEAWAADNPDLAATLPTVATSRGRHVYARADVPDLLAQLNGAGFKDLGDGELRVSGCICVLPPSRHESGLAYSWVVPLDGEVPFHDPYEVGFLQRWSSSPVVTERDGEGHMITEITDARGDGLGKPLESARVDQIPLPPISVDANIPADVLMMIAKTIPKGHGQRHRQVFELARGLKSIPRISDADMVELKPFVRYWHKCSLDMIRTKPFEETWIDFTHAWKNVKFALGAEPIREIFEKACGEDIPQFALEDYEQEGVIRLILLCRELQRQNPKEPFYLSVRTAQRLLELPYPMDAHRWLHLLRIDKVIQEVIKGGMNFKQVKGKKKPVLVSRKASRYKYLREI